MYKKIIDLFFISLLFEGVVRKWILPDADIIVQVVRDSLPFVALLSYHMNGNKIRLLTLLQPGPRFCFVVYVIISCLSLESLFNQPFVYVIGLRTHFAFIPLMIMAPRIWER